MKTPVIHYAGGVRTARMMILGGWAACCSGDKAERIRATGKNTLVLDEVTCKACLRVMSRAVDDEMEPLTDTTGCDV